MASNSTSSPAPEVVLAQITVAFGQGAGSLFLSEDAAIAALAVYSPKLTDFARDWATVAPQVLEYARSVGRTAGWLATQRGSSTIFSEDFQESMTRVHAAQRQGAFGICPFRHPPSL